MRRHEETDQVAGRAAWRAVDLSRDPHLVLGKRRGRGIEGLRLEVHRDLFEDMRLVCSAALDAIFSSTGRQYEPYAELERGEEYFELPWQTYRSHLLPLDGYRLLWAELEKIRLRFPTLRLSARRPPLRQVAERPPRRYWLPFSRARPSACHRQ